MGARAFSNDLIQNRLPLGWSQLFLATGRADRVNRILLVEDDALTAERVRETLASADGPDFDLVHVATLEAAFEHLQEHLVDVVLLDVELSSGDGLQGLVQLRAEFSEVPVIVLSRAADSTQTDRALMMGADGLIANQGGGLRDLMRSIRYALGQRRYGAPHSIRDQQTLASSNDDSELPLRVLRPGLAAHVMP